MLPGNSYKLHAYLAQLGIGSRRSIEKLIQAGKITVDGTVSHIGQRIVPGTVNIAIDGKPVTSPLNQPIYLKMYKKRGLVSTVSDELNRKTVVDDLPPNFPRVYPVGRLDVESEGLLLLTNDGEITYILTHPKFEISKTYHVLLEGIPSSKALQLLRKGVKLKEGITSPLELQILGHENQQRTWLSITILEGRYQQVRRMMLRIGYNVLRLKRVKMGPITLENLNYGEWKPLTEQEIQSIQALKP